ncbi:MAG: hypothetical protein JW714_02600 [Candidatus Omnitrophica bacterium]|nr:hypothetical protein [Candidatus Omnitrophota bacterium]
MKRIAVSLLVLGLVLGKMVPAYACYGQDYRYCKPKVRVRSERIRMPQHQKYSKKYRRHYHRVCK